MSPGVAHEMVGHEMVTARLAGNPIRRSLVLSVDAYPPGGPTRPEVP